MGYGQFCAVARSLDVLGERWTLLIVRELLSGSAGYNEIRRGLPGIPRATLATRLRSLVAAGVVETSEAGYELTEAGRRLAPILAELAGWASRWDRRGLRPEHLDTELLTWDMRRRVDAARLPVGLVVVELEFIDRPADDRRFWLHLSKGSIELCRTDTGHPVDVMIAAPLEVITRWWLGADWATVTSHPEVRIVGPPAMRRQVHTWFERYAFAEQSA